MGGWLGSSFPGRLSRSRSGYPGWNTLRSASLLVFLSVLFIKLRWEWASPAVLLDYWLVLLKLKPNDHPRWYYWHLFIIRTLNFAYIFFPYPAVLASLPFTQISHLYLLMTQRMNPSRLYNIRYSFCHVPFVMGKPESLHWDPFHLMDHDQENNLLRSESPVYRARKKNQAQHVMQ